MRSEPTVFLAVSLLTEAVALLLFARTPPREQPGALFRSLVILSLLLAWFFCLIARGHAAPQWVTPFCVSLVAWFAGWLYFDDRVQADHGLRFFPTGVRAYEERGVAGRCLDSPTARFLGIASAVIVTITRDELWVRPTKAIPAAALGLVHRIPLRRIHLMERLGGSRANIRLEYAGQDGWCRCVELRLRNPAVFIQTVREGQLAGLD